MEGQWEGRRQGGRDGLLVVNIDELDNCYAGIAYLYELDASLPGVAVTFRTDSKRSTSKFRRTSLLPLHPHLFVPVDWESIRNLFQPGVQISNELWGTLKRSGKELHVSWDTEIGESGSATLTRPDPKRDSDLRAESLSWEDFKARVSANRDKGLLYRGQSENWKLVTAFHRLGRNDLYRYKNEDIPILHRQLSSRTKHLFRLENAIETGAFYNLVQHHGFPTPLLDWSYSPYVAAFFAYRSLSQSIKNSKKSVRVFEFDHHEWHRDWEAISALDSAKRHVSIQHLLGIENQRMIPQQAVSMFTNVSDIEHHIQQKQNQNSKTYLRAYDIPQACRHEAMSELAYMGITAGSLFPGLDGACEELREKRFSR